MMETLPDKKAEIRKMLLEDAIEKSRSTCRKKEAPHVSILCRFGFHQWMRTIQKWVCEEYPDEGVDFMIRMKRCYRCNEIRGQVIR